jgi:hypothetical protein
MYNDFVNGHRPQHTLLHTGGTLVIACWCQREETPDKPFTDKEREELQFLYDEWAHPYFISIQEFERLMQVRGGEGASFASVCVCVFALVAFMTRALFVCFSSLFCETLRLQPALCVFLPDSLRTWW